MPIYRKTPAKVQDVLRPLRVDIARLVRLWAQWKALYRSDEKNFELMNRYAEGFIGEHWRYQFETIVLAISHLLAKRSVQRVEQCSLAQLSDEILPHELWVKVTKAKSAVKQKAQTVDALRDNAVAHRSLDLIMGKVPKLPAIPWDDVDQILSDIQATYNLVVEHYEGHPESFKQHEDLGKTAATQLLAVFEGHHHCQDAHKKLLFQEFKENLIAKQKEKK